MQMLCVSFIRLFDVMYCITSFSMLGKGETSSSVAVKNPKQHKAKANDWGKFDK